MRPSVVRYLLSAVLTVGGLGVVVWFAGLPVALGILIAMWGHNLEKH